MQHAIPVELLENSLGPQVHGMARAIETCVHCGFCLPTCPTYQVLGEEMDSPRGRIVLMKTVLEGELSVAEAIPYIDRCLGCQACVSACPSGVQYDDLLTPFRAYARSQGTNRMTGRLRHKLIKSTFPEQTRFRRLVAIGQLARPLRRLMPESLSGLMDFLPEHRQSGAPLPEFTPAEGKRRARVALLSGCVQQALDPEINWATLRVLAKNGVEVVVPAGQGCCGAMLLHMGETEMARKLASKNLQTFSLEVDAIVTNAAGCGSGMHDYRQLFQGLDQGQLAESIALKTVDVCSFLDQLGLVEEPGLPQPLRVAYHDSCHLVHAQGISAAPRRLLAGVDNLSLVEIEESEMCCGSAGTYNLDQPQIAKVLGRRKAERILSSGAQTVVMGNIGCMVQIRSHLAAVGKLLPVLHTLEILDLAYTKP